MATSTFSGPVVSKSGFIQTGPANVITANSSTTLTVSEHAGRIVYNSGAGAVTYTLPAINATADSANAGPGADYNNSNNIGAKFTIFSDITKTGSLIVQVANATDVMSGRAIFIDDTSANAVGFNTSASSDTVTLNGTDTGGYLPPSIIECVALATGKWAVTVGSSNSGTPATPFSAAV
jgi:hypothetical protein